MIWTLQTSIRRILARQGSFHRVALLVLSVGVAFASTIWSLHERALVDPLPGIEPGWYGRLASLELHQGEAQYPMSYPLLEELERRTVALEKVLGVSSFSASLFSADTPARRVRIEAVTDDYFAILGIELALGRAPYIADSGPEGIVISYKTWRSHFGGREDILGTEVYLDQREAVVVGVAPRDFRGLSAGSETGVWVTIQRNPASRLNDPASGLFFTVVGLLASGSSPAMLQRELQAFASTLKPPVWGLEASGAAVRFLVFDGVGLDGFTTRDLRTRFRILFAIAAMVLLSAMLSAAGLLLSASLAGRKQWAIACALGASRPRMFLQAAADVLVLAGAVALLGTILASLGESWLGTVGLISESPEIGFRWNWKVFGFALLLSLVTAFLSSVLPAMAGTRIDLVEGLRDVGHVPRSYSKWKSGLVVGQLTASFFLVFGSVLLLVSLANVYAIDLGIDPAGVTSAYIEPSSVGLQGEDTLQFARKLWDRLRVAASFEFLSFAEISPFVGTIRAVLISEAEGAEEFDRPKQVWRNKVTPGFFETLGLRVVAGRDFTVHELLRPPAGGADVVVLSRKAAQMIWPNSSPLRRRLFNQNEQRWLEVVGIVEDHRPYSMFRDAPMIYEPFGQGFVPGRFSILTRVGALAGETPETLQRELVHAVHDLEPRIAVFDLKTLPQRLEKDLQERRSLASTVPLLALAVLILAAMGLWGLMAGAVQLKRRQLGIRMALGARIWDLQRPWLTQTALLVTAGIGIALGFLFMTRDWVARQLYQVQVFEITLLAPIFLGFVTCCLMFSYIPLRRISQIDPSSILREE